MSKSEPKKYRQRKKHLYNSIRDQLEFYFSDSNLSKDRFMNEALKADEYIPVETFLRFNKILALTQSVADVVAAISTSDILELNPDKTKVRRTTEVKVRENVDDYTIYIESLPPTADHEWLKKIFSKYGTIAYVSLPRYAKSRKIKEFAFIEFTKKSSVKKALEGFQEFNSVLRYESMEPANLKSVIAYVKEQNETENPASSSDDETDAESADEKDRSKDEEPVEPPTKKQKLDTTDEEGKPQSDAADTSKEQVDAAESETEKKKRRRRKKAVAAKETIQDTRWKDMKIMAKRDWKRLRNKYLDTQRKKFKEIKKQLMLGRRKEKPVKMKAMSIKNVKASPQNMNFYGALPQQEAASQPESAASATTAAKQVNKAMLQKPLFSFEPGLIVNVKFREPCVDVKDFKDEMRQFPYVKYVDVKEGDMETFVRVDKPSSANLLVKQYTSAEYQSALILSGESETTYWDKILKDRENKLNKTVKVKQARGRDKIIKKAAVHIHFEEEEG